MKMIVIQAWVKGSPNVVPVATCETRSAVLELEITKLFRKEGFRVEKFMREEEHA